MSRNKLQARSKSIEVRQAGRLEQKSGTREKTIVISYLFFDNRQDQTFKDWEEDGILHKLNEKLRSLCSYTVSQAFSEGILKQYTKIDFPEKSEFRHPSTVPDDVVWCSMHILAKPLRNRLF